jgi:urea transport system permease protein
MCWGYGGILSLGQGVFFGLGGYCMAMFLKLEASEPETPRSSRPPAFPTSWTGTRSPRCRSFWSRSTASLHRLLAIILVPGIFALIIGAAMFKRRVGGTYFAIITQASPRS